MERLQSFENFFQNSSFSELEHGIIPEEVIKMSIDALFGAIAQVATYLLPVLGVVALIYLILLIKTLIETLKDVSLTLLTAESELKKLDGPLSTVESLSKTVDDVHGATRKMVTKATATLNKDMEQAKSWMTKKKDELAAKKDELSAKLNKEKEVLKADVDVIQNAVQDDPYGEEEIIYVRDESGKEAE